MSIEQHRLLGRVPRLYSHYGISDIAVDILQFLLPILTLM